jgi:hypothetical protein
MLRIRLEQIGALEATVDHELARRLEPLLTAAFPERVTSLSPMELRRMIGEAIVAGRRYGLSTEAELGDFAGLWIEIGPHFDRDALVQPLLVDGGASPAARLSRLVRRLSEEDWRTIRRRLRSERA